MKFNCIFIFKKSIKCDNPKGKNAADTRFNQSEASSFINGTILQET